MHSLQHTSTHMHPRTCLHSHIQHVLTHTHTNIYRHSHLLPLCMHHTSRLPDALTILSFMSQVHLSPQTLSDAPFFQPPHTPPLLAPLQYGLSTSLLSVRQRYQAKNVSGVDSRHEGTGASTSASEPAGWGIHSSGQVNTAALWNATLSYNKCVCVWESVRVSVDVNKWFIKTTLT